MVRRDHQDLPQRVVHEPKRILLDSTGCAVARLAVDKGKTSAALQKMMEGLPERMIIGTVAGFHALVPPPAMVSSLMPWT